LLDGVDISGPVNLPPPCLWRRCPVLHHDRIVSALVIQFVHWRVMCWTSIDSQARISPVCGQPKTTFPSNPLCPCSVYSTRPPKFKLRHYPALALPSAFFWSEVGIEVLRPAGNALLQREHVWKTDYNSSLRSQKEL